jgi:hypothetical protein
MSKHRPDNLEAILERTVSDYLRRIPARANRNTNEEKAEYISWMCSVGGGTDTCNLITFYPELEKEILGVLNRMSLIVK